MRVSKRNKCFLMVVFSIYLAVKKRKRTYFYNQKKSSINMINLLKKVLFSTRLMSVLFIAFATAMAFGTFIESWYSTETARIWIYNATWFEAMMVFFVINFAGNIKRYGLLKLNKWPVLLLHTSWILIIIGAFVTRYISYEGMMPIREGETEKIFYSDKTYVTLFVDGENEGQPARRSFEDLAIFTPEAKKTSLPWTSDFANQDFKVAFVSFQKGAQQGLIEDPNGSEFLKIVEAGDGNRHDHFLASGEVTSIHNILFALNSPTVGAININTTTTPFSINTPFEGDFLRMADQLKGVVIKDSVQELQMRSLYNIGGMQFVIPELPIKGINGIVAVPEAEQTPETKDALTVSITSNGETKNMTVLGSKGMASYSEKLSLAGLDFTLGYGSKVYELPFSIKLNDFIAEKYPGTEKGYASFMSRVTIENSRPFDYDIFMNHVLDHGGYRFFQSSFHPDEKGTVLSVSHDFWGTWITYVGYFLLYIGLMGILFFGNTRFKDLARTLEKVKAKKAALTLLMLVGFGFSSFSQQPNASANDDTHAHSNPKETATTADLNKTLQNTLVTKEHAAKFGSIVIQDDGGRMKPINTFASELLRKLSFKTQYEGLNPDQVLLSMMINPALWYNTPFIALDKKGQNDSLRHILGVPEGQRYVKATDFFNEDMAYKLAPYLEDAYATTNPNKFQKDFQDIDLRLGLLNRALGGEILKIFPLLDDENNKWISAVEYRSGAHVIADSLYSNFVKNSIPFYLMSLEKAIASKDYTQSDKLLQAFTQNQNNHGSEVMPSQNKIQAEVWYNQLDIFNKLYKYYALTGVLMFFFLIFQIFKERKFLKGGIYLFKFLVWGLFALHTSGLIMRWYISGHAPWSDAYESILYVSWATLAMGIALGRKSDLTLAATTFVTAMLLWIAHQSWVDPSVANLVPVLDSYWLMIHVAVIVGSYGPLTVGMILGIVSLVLIIMTNEKNKKKMDLNLKELTIINELSITVGLIMLTIGNFLGGQWANESWGRYWGWDPKETWALISILIYAFVIHTRLVPGLRGRWTFNFLSIVAYASIMMTYFGVNFYLVGLHSYASGSQVITPTFIYYCVIGVILLGGISFWRNKIFSKK